MNIKTKELFIIMPLANTFNKEIENTENDDILLVKATFIYVIVRFIQNDKSCKVIKCIMT